MAMVDEDNISLQVDSQPRLVWSVGRHFAALLYVHQMNWLNSRNDLCYDDSTINIVKIIIIIIIIIIHVSQYSF